jgi:Fe-Mn family superoxide dismutase
VEAGITGPYLVVQLGARSIGARYTGPAGVCLMTHELPVLPYALDALQPAISAETLALHHGKHHRTYVDKLNEALAKTPQFADWSVERLLTELDGIDASIRAAVRNHGGGHHNHWLFWRTLGPGGAPPAGEIGKAIDRAFGGFDAFRAAFEKDAAGLFGSGWTFLAWNPQREAVEILSLPNQDSPLTRGLVPLMLCDLWEHAYYLSFRNRRPDWIKAWWTIVDWRAVERELAAAHQTRA